MVEVMELLEALVQTGHDAVLLRGCWFYLKPSP